MSRPARRFPKSHETFPRRSTSEDHRQPAQRKESITMKAVAVLPGKQEVQIVEHEPPKLTSPTGVKLKMLEVGVCGTDREICAFEYGTPPAGFEYLVLGH